MGRANGYNAKRQRLVSVLDVGTSKVCCMIARMGPAPEDADEPGQEARLRVIGFGHQRSQGIKSGTLVHMDAAEQAIRAAVDQAERMAGLTIDEVILSVSCGRLRSDNFSAGVSVSGDAVRAHDIGRVMSAGKDYAARGGRIVLHTLATGYRLDDDEMIQDPTGMIADRLRVDIHAVAAEETPLRNLMLCIERCHLSVGGLVAAPYASGLAAVTQEEIRLGATCIDLGAGTTTFSVFADGHFLYCDALALGGNHVTLDLARCLSTPLEEAERIKTLHGCAFAAASDESEIISFPMVGEQEPPQFNQATKAQVGQIIQARIEEILGLVRERLAEVGLGAMAGQHMVLTGGASQLTGLSEFAARVFSKAVRLGRPRQLPGLSEYGTGPAFATASGMLHHARRGEAEFTPQARAHAFATGAGYLSRVGQWIRESF